jgi:hypothetical protein
MFNGLSVLNLFTNAKQSELELANVCKDGKSNQEIIISLISGGNKTVNAAIMLMKMPEKKSRQKHLCILFQKIMIK